METQIKSKIKERGKKSYKAFDTGRLQKILFWIIGIFFPAGIGYMSGIINNNNDITTKTFLVIIFILYLIGLILIYPVLSVKQEMDILIKEYNHVTKVQRMHNNERYLEMCDIVKFYNMKTLRMLFNQLNKTLKVENKKEDNGENYCEYYLTKDIGYFFNEDKLIYENIYEGIINHISQSLTGIGMFGTFLGIVNGVSKLNMDSAQEIKNSVVILLRGVKVSFYSSLYGLLFSLILIFIFKVVTDLVMKKAYKLCEMINEIVNVYNEYEDIEKMKIQLERQSILIKKLIKEEVLH